MPKEVRQYILEELCNENNEILLVTENNTELHIELTKENKTLISFPFGNQFEVKGNYIVIEPVTPKPYYLVDNKCLTCNQDAIIDGNEVYDPCIGKVHGAMNACCGHGDIGSAYIQFANKDRIGGQDALDIMKIMKKNKDNQNEKLS